VLPKVVEVMMSEPEMIPYYTQTLENIVIADV